MDSHFPIHRQVSLEQQKIHKLREALGLRIQQGLLSPEEAQQGQAEIDATMIAFQERMLNPAVKLLLEKEKQQMLAQKQQQDQWVGKSSFFYLFKP
jgi:hypothetical protein